MVAIGLAYGIYVNVINAKTVDYTKPSQTKSYPKLKNHPNAWIDVSIRKQRVYIKDGSRVLYTMYCSTGLNNSTPTGTFSRSRTIPLRVDTLNNKSVNPRGCFAL